MTPRLAAASALVALLLLVLAWHFVLAPPSRMSPALAFLLHASPLLPALVLLLLGRRSAPFWGALGALLLFCHGIAEAWSDAEVTALALLETGLSVVLIFAASWDGLRARVAKRRGV